MTYKVYAPNVHLFAYHLRDDSLSDDYDNKLLWHKCQEIFAKFAIPQDLKIKDVAPNQRVDLLEEATDTNICLALEGTIILDTKQKTRVTGIVCPLQIYDSYALALNLRINELDEFQKKTEEVDISIFKKFNPDNCFLSTNMHSSLGQTLLLTAWLSPAQQQDAREIAQQCVHNFCGQTRECPQFYQESKLFGSPIFEYGDPNSSHGYEHILVWLFFAEEKEETDKYYAKADENLGLFYRTFIDLFFYRNKVIKAFHFSRGAYVDIRESYKYLKETVGEITNIATIKNGKLSNYELKSYQTQLNILPSVDLRYSENFAELDKYRLTIEINTKNYREKLKQIQIKVQEKFPSEDFSFLEYFHEIISTKFAAQIKADLGYFTHTSGLVDKAITSIRGIVEAEQAERDRSLENTVQVLGIAFGGGAIVSGVVTQNINKPFVFELSDVKYSISPLALSLFWSFFATIIFWVVAWLIFKPKRKKNKQK